MPNWVNLKHVQLWWNIFIEAVQPKLSDDCAGLAANLSQLDLTPGSETNYPGTSEEVAVVDILGRRKAWESGRIDYLGTDAFENIQKRLDESINTPS